MSVIYIDEQGASIHKKGELLYVKKDEEVIAKLPLAHIDRIIIVGQVTISSHALTFLMDRGIPTAFITWYGRFRGWIAPAFGKNVALRIKQAQMYNDDNFRLKFAKNIVSAKIKNLLFQLKAHARNHPEQDFGKNILQIENMIKRINNIDNRDSLRGTEGAAAASYFSALGMMVRKEFQFTRRTRRPPADPVNAVLSLGYTVLSTEMVSAVSGVGMDPYIGFYHDVDYGRPSLALDLLEEFRYLADSLALKLVNKGMLKAEHFEESNESGVYLTEEGRAIFFRQYEYSIRKRRKRESDQIKVNFRKVFFDQAQSMARAVRGIEDYKPYIIS